MSERQRTGQALEKLAYETLKELLQSKIAIRGEEKATKKGILWIGGNYRLFWNKHRVKEGWYPKFYRIKGESILRPLKGPRKRTTKDLLVVCVNVFQKVPPSSPLLLSASRFTYELLRAVRWSSYSFFL